MEMVVADLADLKKVTATADVLRLYRYWEEKRASRNFPSRTDIDPIEFKFALNKVSLVDVTQDPRRFFYRLVSTTLTDRLGYEMTRKWVDEIPEDDVRQYVKGLYTRAVEARLPLYEKSKRIFDNKIWEHEALLLPLSSDNNVLDMLLAYRTTYSPERLAAWAQSIYRD